MDYMLDFPSMILGFEPMTYELRALR